MRWPMKIRADCPAGNRSAWHEESVAEGHGLVARVERDAGGEVVSVGVAHLGEPAEPFGFGGLAGLDFERGYSPVGGFDDDVEFGAGAVLPVVNDGVSRCRGELAPLRDQRLDRVYEVGSRMDAGQERGRRRPAKDYSGSLIMDSVASSPCSPELLHSGYGFVLAHCGYFGLAQAHAG
jgi:hypothetical protein